MCMISKDKLQQFSKFRALLVVLLAVIFSLLFAPHHLTSFITTAVVLSIVGNLLAYNKWQWLILFILSLTPTFTSTFFSIHPPFSVLDNIIFYLIFLLSLGFSYFIARKTNIIPKFNWKYFSITKLLAGFALLFLASILTGIIAQLIRQSPDTANQEALNQLQKLIPMAIFVIQTVAAGFFEELTYRVGIFEIVFKKHRNIAFLVAMLLFAYMHGPTDLYSWLTYGLMSLILTSFYAKYRNFYLNMSIHMLWNLFGILVAFLVK